MTQATSLFAACTALHLTSRHWVNAGIYGPPTGTELAPPVLNTGVLATRPPRRAKYALQQVEFYF